MDMLHNPYGGWPTHHEDDPLAIQRNAELLARNCDLELPAELMQEEGELADLLQADYWEEERGMEEVNPTFTVQLSGSLFDNKPVRKGQLRQVKLHFPEHPRSFFKICTYGSEIMDGIPAVCFVLVCIKEPVDPVQGQNFLLGLDEVLNSYPIVCPDEEHMSLHRFEDMLSFSPTLPLVLLRDLETDQFGDTPLFQVKVDCSRQTLTNKRSYAVHLCAQILYRETGSQEIQVCGHTSQLICFHGGKNTQTFLRRGFTQVEEDLSPHSTNNQSLDLGQSDDGLVVPYQRVKFLGQVFAESFYLLSDETTKQNMRALPEGLEKLMKLSGKAYEFKNSPSVPKRGFSAQQLQEVYPEAVTVDPRSNKLHVDSFAILALLVESLKELNCKVNSFKESDRTDGSEYRIEEMKKTVQELLDNTESWEEQALKGEGPWNEPCIQLVSLTRKGINVLPRGLMFMGLRSELPVCIISVSGLTGIGKSFLTSYLINDSVDNPAFLSRHGDGTTTEGLWLYNGWLDNHFRKCTGIPDSTEPAVLCVDAEGSGEAEDQMFFQAMEALKFMMSSVVLWNVGGGKLVVNEALRELYMYVLLSKHRLSSTMWSESTEPMDTDEDPMDQEEEEQDDEVEDDEASDFELKEFGHLVIVVRDTTGPLESCLSWDDVRGDGEGEWVSLKSGIQNVNMDGYSVHTSLHRLLTEEEINSTDEESRAKQKRNAMRRIIKKYGFKSISIIGMPCPTLDPSDAKETQILAEHITPKFKNAVVQLRSLVHEKILLTDDTTTGKSCAKRISKAHQQILRNQEFFVSIDMARLVAEDKYRTCLHRHTITMKCVVQEKLEEFEYLAGNELKVWAEQELDGELARFLNDLDECCGEDEHQEDLYNIANAKFNKHYQKCKQKLWSTYQKRHHALQKELGTIIQRTNFDKFKIFPELKPDHLVDMIMIALKNELNFTLSATTEQQCKAAIRRQLRWPQPEGAAKPSVFSGVGDHPVAPAPVSTEFKGIDWNKYKLVKSTGFGKVNKKWPELWHDYKIVDSSTNEVIARSGRKYSSSGATSHAKANAEKVLLNKMQAETTAKNSANSANYQKQVSEYNSLSTNATVAAGVGGFTAGVVAGAITKGRENYKEFAYKAQAIKADPNLTPEEKAKQISDLRTRGVLNTMGHMAKDGVVSGVCGAALQKVAVSIPKGNLIGFAICGYYGISELCGQVSLHRKGVIGTARLLSNCSATIAKITGGLLASVGCGALAGSFFGPVGAACGGAVGGVFAHFALQRVVSDIQALFDAPKAESARRAFDYFGVSPDDSLEDIALAFEAKTVELANQPQELEMLKIYLAIIICYKQEQPQDQNE
eukprot:CAMPEP_0174254556 /NCGR_PEP_ID=MMETSP0439-20130205/3874_1 /TAXON_ID=0 /ORGANISM="Stereomyxa ramosa, Strain Chinc5" /LENGTH=1340 /DNA_ID=CAMNT_0015336213 /DNA_START=45 /DNA_END=4067 /DNA_ORIENTATION=+